MADGLVLGGALPQSERMLAPISVDTQCHADAVVADLNPVDEQRHQIELAEVAPEHLGQLLLGGLNEPPRDRRL
jgi:hypothetical protein